MEYGWVVNVMRGWEMGTLVTGRSGNGDYILETRGDGVQGTKRMGSVGMEVYICPRVYLALYNWNPSDWVGEQRTHVAIELSLRIMQNSWAIYIYITTP
jgi:hypothetical protein